MVGSVCEDDFDQNSLFTVILRDQSSMRCGRPTFYAATSDFEACCGFNFWVYSLELRDAGVHHFLSNFGMSASSSRTSSKTGSIAPLEYRRLRIHTQALPNLQTERDTLFGAQPVYPEVFHRWSHRILLTRNDFGNLTRLRSIAEGPPNAKSLRVRHGLRKMIGGPGFRSGTRQSSVFASPEVWRLPLRPFYSRTGFFFWYISSRFLPTSLSVAA